MTILPAKRSLRIVVVDDNPDILESMEMVLSALGHDTATCASGEQAVVTIAEWRPDAAFVDATLPGISGYDVARAICAIGISPPPVLIAMTGWDREEDRLRAIDSGFTVHAVKPLDLAQLRTLLDDIAARLTHNSDRIEQGTARAQSSQQGAR